MSKLSRRSVVTSAAALPAFAVPAVAYTATSADDRLVALAAEVHKVHDELYEAIVVTDTAQGTADDAAYVAAQAAQEAVSDRMHGVIDAMEEIRAQSIRGLAAKARVADLLLREDGEVHSISRSVWTIVDDLLAMEGAQS
jgi:hypothetical protein